VKKPKVLILFLVVCVLGLFAGIFDPIGEVLWTNTHDSGLGGNDYGFDTAVDSQGNVIVVGYVQAPENYGVNGYAMKYNPAGDQVLWYEEFDSGLIGGSGGADSADAFYGVCIDSQDNIIIVGQKAVIFGPYPSNQIFYIVKYDSDGILDWDEEWYVYGWDTARDVCVDENDDIYVVGSDFGSWGPIRGRWTLLKYDKEGGAPILGPIYHDYLANEFVQDICYGVNVDNEGNIICVGVLGISGVGGGLTNNLDWHVRKYNSSGGNVWDKTYAGAANLYDYAMSVDTDSNGHVYVVGYTNVGTDNSTNADYDWLVIKYDKDDGTPLWTKPLESAAGRSEWGYGIAVDFEDNVIVSGMKKSGTDVPNRAIVKLRGADGGIMNVQWWNSADNEYFRKMDHNYGRIVMAGDSHNGTDYDMHGTCLVPEFNNLRLVRPLDGTNYSDPPTFKWNPDGGETNAFSIEIAFNPGGPWRTTKDDLGIIIWDNSWTMPTNVWNWIPSGWTIYWRVRGADTTISPLSPILSNEMWSFTKN
jgi:hypothetical protein